VKHIKMELLALVSNDTNTSEIVAELAEYVSDVNADMARHAIRSIAQVGLRGVAFLADRVPSNGRSCELEPVLVLPTLDLLYVWLVHQRWGYVWLVCGWGGGGRLRFACPPPPIVSLRPWWTSSTMMWTTSSQKQWWS
jgi:hypothetical protein